MTTTWTPFAQLASYPGVNTIAGIRNVLPALESRAPAAAAAIARFLDATAATPLGVLQEQYTADFDFDPACALNVGWHLFGESRERGAFLAALREDLRRAGVAESSELPDHLTHVLALIERDEPVRAAELAAIVLPAVACIERGLTARNSPYAHVLQGLYAELSAIAEHTVATG